MCLFKNNNNFYIKQFKLNQNIHFLVKILNSMLYDVTIQGD